MYIKIILSNISSENVGKIEFKKITTLFFKKIQDSNKF